MTEERPKKCVVGTLVGFYADEDGEQQDVLDFDPVYVEMTDEEIEQRRIDEVPRPKDLHRAIDARYEECTQAGCVIDGRPVSQAAYSLAVAAGEVDATWLRDANRIKREAHAAIDAGDLTEHAAIAALEWPA